MSSHRDNQKPRANSGSINLVINNRNWGGRWVRASGVCGALLFAFEVPHAGALGLLAALVAWRIVAVSTRPQGITITPTFYLIAIAIAVSGIWLARGVIHAPPQLAPYFPDAAFECLGASVATCSVILALGIRGYSISPAQKPNAPVMPSTTNLVYPAKINTNAHNPEPPIHGAKTLPSVTIQKQRLVRAKDYV